VAEAVLEGNMYELSRAESTLSLLCDASVDAISDPTSVAKSNSFVLLLLSKTEEEVLRDDVSPALTAALTLLVVGCINAEDRELNEGPIESDDVSPTSNLESIFSLPSLDLGNSSLSLLLLLLIRKSYTIIFLSLDPVAKRLEDQAVAPTLIA
jgi:hypothetical protein